MIDLLDVFSHDSPLDWVIASVEEVHTNPPSFRAVIGAPAAAGASTSVLARTAGDNAVRIEDVAYLAGYTPAVGDIVHIIVKSNIGALCLGKVAT